MSLRCLGKSRRFTTVQFSYLYNSFLCILHFYYTTTIHVNSIVRISKGTQEGREKKALAAASNSAKELLSPNVGVPESVTAGTILGVIGVDIPKYCSLGRCLMAFAFCFVFTDV